MGEDRQSRQDRRAGLTGYDDQAEIRNAVSYERVLAAKALIPLLMVGLVIVIFRAIHG